MYTSWFTKKSILVFIGLFLTTTLFSSCNSQGTKGRKKIISDDASSDISGSGSNVGGSAAGPYEGGTVGGDVAQISAGVELRWIVDPVDGSFSKKPTIPKNFSGTLYLAGLNISTLSSKHVAVRFKFGLSLEPVTIIATVARAENQGITPSVDVELLALDLSSRPFKDIKLLYDLYDYNQYNFDGVLGGATPDNPITDPNNQNLYCRGVDLNYDSSFAGSSCSSAGDTCKFAYAKVIDKGFQDISAGVALGIISGIPLIPYEAQIDFSGNGYIADTVENKIKKCNPEDGTFDGVDYKLNPPYPTLVDGLNSYTYSGPYRALNYANWDITGDAVIGQYGIFLKHLTLPPPYTGILSSNIAYGLQSLLFPRYGKMELQSGTTYLGVASGQPANDTKIENTLLANGETEWMDGCNIRVSNYDSDLNEGIGSCSVTATIDIVEVNPITNEVIGDPIVSSKDVKLQLTRANEINSSGDDMLYNSFKRCSSSSSCSANECCFNERCWSNDLISMCIEDSQVQGNYSVGSSCTSDFQCSSLCCDKSSGRCAVHDNTLQPEVLCSHPPGSQCVSKEWCRKETVTQCLIVKTGIDPQGNQTCALRCYNKQEYGNCVSGICTPPTQPFVPYFDSDNPDCSAAVDPPSSI